MESHTDEEILDTLVRISEGGLRPWRTVTCLLLCRTTSSISEPTCRMRWKH